MMTRILYVISGPVRKCAENKADADKVQQPSQQLVKAWYRKKKGSQENKEACSSKIPAVILVERLVMDPEELVVCPYDPVHRVARKRMQYHLIKCRKNYCVKDYKTCPFNARHVIPSPEFEYHIKDCPDRAKLDAEVLQRQQNTEGCRLKGNTSIPAYDADWLVPQSTEDWDTDNVLVLPPQVRDTLYSAPSTGNPRDVTNQKKREEKPPARERVSEPPHPRMPKMGTFGSQVFQYSLATSSNRPEEGQGQRTYPLGRGRGRGRGMVSSGSSMPGRMVGAGRGLTPQQIPALQPLPVPAQPQFSSLQPQPGQFQGLPPPPAASVQPPEQRLPPPPGFMQLPSPAVAQPAVHQLTEEDLRRTERKLRKMLRQIEHLEEKQERGEQLDPEQLTKIYRKGDVIAQLEQLKL